MNNKHRKAVLTYQLKIKQLRDARRLFEFDEDEALNKLLKQLNEDESPPGANVAWGETFRELFYCGRGKTKLCISRASEASGIPVAPERDCVTP
jgi:hypothetical protein